MVFLHSHGVGTARAVRIFRTYGADAVEVMTENPYRLARDIRGIGFRTADAIAMKLGIEKTAMVRVRAGIGYALTEAMDEGHCGLPEEELGPLANPPPGGPRRSDPNGARSGVGRRHGGCGHGGEYPLCVPRRPASGGEGDRRAASADCGRQDPLARCRSRQGIALGRAEDRAHPGAESGRCGPGGALVQGLGDYRRGRASARRRSSTPSCASCPPRVSISCCARRPGARPSG